MRSPFLFTLIVFCIALGAAASEHPKPSYAELQVGIATPAGFTTHNDVESERVAPGSLGTTSCSAATSRSEVGSP
ncbi:MAG: hypothetical protein IPG71_06435 [bacterium]|nr:hypothetical protein [bacterium]